MGGARDGEGRRTERGGLAGVGRMGKGTEGRDLEVTRPPRAAVAG